MGRRRLGASAWVATAGLLAASCQVEPPASVGDGASLARIEALKRCSAFDGLDIGRMLRMVDERPPIDMEAIEAAHSRIRGPAGALPVPEGAQVALTTMAGPGETQSTPTHTSSMVWLDAAGIWRFDRVDYAPYKELPPRPPPPGWDGSPMAGWTSEEVEAMRRTHSTGVLAPALAAAIETALADPCFALQPDAVPLDPPAAPGTKPRPPCYGVLYGGMLLNWPDGRRRLVSEPCGGFYAGDAIGAVLYARDPEADEALRRGVPGGVR